MKTFRAFLIGGLLMTVAAISAMAQSVQTDYDHNFNLAGLKSYGFYEQTRKPTDPLAASPINDRRIHDAIDNQLRNNGFTSKAQPDFWITYFVKTKKGLDIQDNRMGVLQRWGNVNVSEVTEGTLVVVFVDSKTRLEVWRGYASGTITPKNLDKDVNKAVSKLIQKFTKNQSGQQ